MKSSFVLILAASTLLPFFDAQAKPTAKPKLKPQPSTRAAPAGDGAEEYSAPAPPKLNPAKPKTDKPKSLEDKSLSTKPVASTPGGARTPSMVELSRIYP